MDTAKTQKTAYQRNRMRFAQVRPSTRMPTSPGSGLPERSQHFWLVALFPQRNLRRDKDRRNLTQFNMQTLPKSAKQKER